MISLRKNAPKASDPLQQVNDPNELAFRNPLQLEYMRILVNALRLAIGEMLTRNTAAPHVLLTSPNGTVYKVTVADDGTLTTVNARGSNVG